MRSDAMKENFFLHRLSNLQTLCSSSNVEMPNALVFIPGLDGKQNKGSLMILKYLFQGSVGRDIYEASLDDSFDCLEEIALIIQESAVSIFWSNAARAAVGPILNSFPYLLEYCPTEEEEEDVDAFEARKCEDFKRMMLESVPEGGVVGLPVPLGYDDVLDTENWPLLQSFALDSVVCPTGFFTSRYAVIDITETLDVMFCTIDGYYVEKAITVLQSNVINHLDQVLDPLRNSHGPDQRRSIKASEIVSPLQLLFEFGSLDTAFPVDPTLQPVLFLGAEKSLHVLGQPVTGSKWGDTTVGSSLSAILEACEPSTGMRWCRTYFLQRGKCLDKIFDPEALVSSEGKDGDEEGRGGSGMNSTDIQHMSEAGVVIDRMEALHQRLCTAFRYSVKTAFSQHGDVLEAGGAVQEMMHSFMTGGVPLDDGCFGESVVLQGSEHLQVHMDCLNAHGQLVGIEDVDDMGGQCWTYIRVSVHGIAGVNGKETYAVAHGDTFLFSSFFSQLAENSGSVAQKQFGSLSLFTHMQDSFCLTHIIPRTAYVLGPEEENMARKFLASTGSFHMISSLGLGKAYDTSGTGVVGVTMLTDHPAAPVLHAEMRLFTSGFIVEKVDRLLLPFLFSFAVHVKEMWTVDLSDCYRRALASKAFESSDTSPVVNIPDGLLVVLQCHDFRDEKGNMGKGSDANSHTVKSCIEYNMLDRILPATGRVRHVAFRMSSDSSRHGSALSEAHHAWRVAARMNDIPDNRGGGNDLPDEILGPFLAMIDRETAGHRSMENELLGTALSGDSNTFGGGTVQIPGSGYLSMRETFFLAENLRLSQPSTDGRREGEDEGECKGSEGKISDVDSDIWDGLLVEDGLRNEIPKKRVVLVVGTAGSGVLVNASQVLNRLAADDIDSPISPSSRSVSSALVVLDLTQDFPEEVIRNGIRSILATSDSDNVVVAAISSPAGHMPISSVVSKIGVCGCHVSFTISVITAQSIETHLQSHSSVTGLGFEAWTAAGKELLCSGVADFVIFIEDKKAANCPSLNELFRSLAHDPVSERMPPGQLWLDAETIESIGQSLSAPAQTGKRISLQPSSFARRPSQVVPQFRGLCSVRIPLPSGAGRWDLERLEGVIKRVLFPGASVSNNCSQQHWSAPQNTRGLVGMARCIELAKVKVFTTRQTEEGRSIFSDFLSSLEDTDGVESLRSGVLGLHASLSAKNDKGMTLLEASAGAVIVRKWLGIMASSSSALDEVCVQGVFSEKDVQLLREVLTKCTPHFLSEKQEKTTADLTTEEKTLIQSMNSELVVPDGWWFDGSSFVDVHGKRSLVRPDTSHLNDLYLAGLNEDIVKYNKFLREIKAHL